MATGQVDVEYEVCEGYPSYFEIHGVTGERLPKNNGMFGYPAEMLNVAATKDDPVGFEFYFTRYFDKGCEVFALNYRTTLDEYLTARKAKKCAAWLKAH